MVGPGFPPFQGSLRIKWLERQGQFVGGGSWSALLYKWQCVKIGTLPDFFFFLAFIMIPSVMCRQERLTRKTLINYDSIHRAGFC